MEVQAVPREPDRVTPAPLDSEQTLVLVFGSPGAEEHTEAARELRVAFPRARVVGCSTSGAPSTTAVRFRRIGMRSSWRPLPPSADATAAVTAFVADLTRTQPDEAPPALVLVFVRRSGADVGELLAAIRAAVPAGTTLAGGLAGGGEEAWVMGLPERDAADGADAVVGVALHGRDLVVHQHAASRPGPERAGGAAVSLAIGRGAEPPGSEARIVVGGLAPFHGLDVAPAYDDAVVTTVHERPVLVVDEFEDVETQVTEVPPSRPRPTPPPPPPPPAASPPEAAPPIAPARPEPAAEQLGFYVTGGWTASLPAARDGAQTLLVVCGAPSVARDSRALRQLGRVFGRSHTVGFCGPLPAGRTELALEVRLVRFERLSLRTASAPIEPGGDPEAAGRRVAAQLRADGEGPVAVLALSAAPAAAPTRHQAGMASVLGPVPCVVIHGAASGTEAPWAWDGTRLAGAMLVAVGLYRVGLAPEAAEALAAEVGGQQDALDGFWRLAAAVDRAEVGAAEAVVRAEPPPPEYGALLAREGARIPQADAAAPAPNRPGPAPVPSPNASATPVPAPPTAGPPPPPPDDEAAADASIDEVLPADPVPPPPDDDDATVGAEVDAADHRLEIAERQRPVAAGLDVRVREIDGVSVVTLTGPLDATLDGPALAARLGEVVLFDLDGVEEVADGGVAAWQSALDALAERGVSVFLARCAEAVVAAGPELWTRAEIVSLFAPYRCAPCGAAFSALYDVRAPGVLAALGRATVPCPSCAEAAVLDADPQRYTALAPRAARRAPPAVVAIARGLPMREGPELSAGPPVAPPPGPASGGAPSRVAVPTAAAPAVLLAAGAVGLAAVTGLALFGAAVGLRWMLDAGDSEAGVSAAPLPPLAAPVGPDGVVPPLTAVRTDALPPAWVETRLKVGDDQVLAVGRSGAAPDPATALAVARTDAVLALIHGVADALHGKPAWTVIEPSLTPALTPEQRARAVARFEAHLGPTAQVVRDDTWSRALGDGVEVAARYALDREAWDRLVDAYAELAEFRGVRVGLLFPTLAARLPGDGQLVVVEVEDWEREARIGDVVLAVEDQPVRTVAQFADEADRAWRRAQVGRSVDVQILSNGIPSELRFFPKGSGSRGTSFKGRPLSTPR